MEHDFERGYFCAVAQLLRINGLSTTNAESLFSMGGDVSFADDEDKSVFREFGLLKDSK